MHGFEQVWMLLSCWSCSRGVYHPDEHGMSTLFGMIQMDVPLGWLKVNCAPCLRVGKAEWKLAQSRTTERVLCALPQLVLMYSSPNWSSRWPYPTHSIVQLISCFHQCDGDQSEDSQEATSCWFCGMGVPVSMGRWCSRGERGSAAGNWTHPDVVAIPAGKSISLVGIFGWLLGRLGEAMFANTVTNM